MKTAKALLKNMRADLDTWASLPIVTRPIPVVALEASASLAGLSITAQRRVVGARADEAESARWSLWGAARAGARVVITARQTLTIAILALLIAAALLLDMRLLAVTTIGALTWMYLLAGAYKTWLMVRGERALRLAATSAAATGADTGDAPADADLPMYTVLVPLFHEKRILQTLVGRLSALDYPRERLEILLLVEYDDRETRAAIAACELPSHIRALRVPPGEPRTKPRALNVGLAHARGEFIVVYDAEDRPEPDQLRKAVASFRAESRQVACLQARLNFYNSTRSLLSRLFAIDYTMWYDLLLPGLTQLQGFVPLGGTSNHFRVPALRRLGGWDPYNVTEDCDLGARIACAGLRVAMLDSTTWEEAVTRVRPWVRQRSRWIKGYMQTYLVHMRHPVALWRAMGPLGFLDFQLLVGGASLAMLVNPLMWLLTLAYAVSRDTAVGAAIQGLFPPAVYYPSLVCLLIGNFVFLYSNLYVCVRSGRHNLTRYALLGPLYWLLMSVGAWAGLLSLIRNPFYWAKTEHGVSLADEELPRARAARAARITAGPRRAIGPALSIVIPAYNEAMRLPLSLSRLRRYIAQRRVSCEVIVVDDGSTDGTGRLVREAMPFWPGLRLVEGPHHGKGGALRAGVRAARGRYVALADADFSMPVEELERFSDGALGEYDVAIASRAAEGALREGEPALRTIMSRTFNRLVRLLLLPGIQDTQCGFKFLRREVAVELCADQTIDGWGFDVELLYLARTRGYAIREVGITWRYVAGSRISPARDTLRMLRDLLAIRLNGWAGRYRRAHVDPASSLSASAYAHRSPERMLAGAAID